MRAVVHRAHVTPYWILPRRRLGTKNLRSYGKQPHCGISWLCDNSLRVKTTKTVKVSLKADFPKVSIISKHSPLLLHTPCTSLSETWNLGINVSRLKGKGSFIRSNFIESNIILAYMFEDSTHLTVKYRL